MDNQQIVKEFIGVVSDIDQNLESVIEAEMPTDENKIMEFIASLKQRFPELNRTVPLVFEKVYEKRFNKKYQW